MYQTILTKLGLAKVAQAIADADELVPAEIQVSQMVFGDGNGNPTTPSSDQIALIRQVFAADLNRLELDVANNRYIAEAVIPAGQGGWTIREVGLVDTDGDLFAVANFPDIYKPTPGEGATRDLVVRLVFEVTNAVDVTLIIDPSVVLATRSWVEGNFDLAALLPGGTTHQILRKRSNADGDVEWYDALAGLNIVVDIVQEEQTLAGSQTVVNLTTATTNGLAVYIEGIRLHPADYTINSPTQIALATAYPAGSKILLIQNEPAGGVTFLQASNNLSDVDDRRESRFNLGFPDAADPDFMNALWKALMQHQYPVGEILTTRREGNPSTWLGFGSWERYGSGRTLVSRDPLDASFQTIDQTGGAKTHVLTIGELPSHTHEVNPPATATTYAGDHTHTPDQYAFGTSGGSGVFRSYVVEETSNVGQGNVTAMATALSNSGGHTHVVDIAAFQSGPAGSGQGHSNLQPYIVVNIWRRTA